MKRPAGKPVFFTKKAGIRERRSCMELELYIHIPFCVRKCNYCDFLSFPGKEEALEKYCKALEKEIKASATDIPVKSIFIGGGTPSLLLPGQLLSLFSCLRKHFCIRKEAEISIEANPGTLNEEKLLAFREAGINRLSIGLQSTDDECLRRLGRIHTRKQFEENYELARKTGFSNINIDLMSGLPGQTISGYKDTLDIVTGLEPEHISSYSLILEEGTPFYESDKIREMLPEEETEREMYEITKEILGKKGYERYEISNYAKKGRECVHNLGYWDGVPYLGLGLGASSFYQGARFSNENNLQKYLENPYIPFSNREDYFEPDQKELMEDYMIFGLRKMRGVSVSEFEKRFGKTMETVYGDVIQRYLNMGLLALGKDRLKLTDAGIDVSNRIFEDFL